jgi:hypothetical protein
MRNVRSSLAAVLCMLLACSHGAPRAAGGLKHTNACAQECVLFVDSPGKFDNKPVVAAAEKK